MAATMSRDQWDGYYAQINSMALSRYPGILQEWLPAGELQGREYRCGSVNGEAGKSFAINVDTGIFADFNGQGDKGGDPIALYAAIHHVKMGEAAKALGEMFGINPPERHLRVAPNNEWRPIVPIPPEIDIPPKRLPSGRPDGELTDAWIYMDAEGRPLIMRQRFELPGGKKEVWPLAWCRNTETDERAWRWKDLPAPRPLYNLERLREKPKANVLIVEGEKCADAGTELLKDTDWVVVTWPGGAERAGAKNSDWSVLKGRKVWVWPDNDDPGKQAATAIAGIFKDAIIVRPDTSWPDKHDIADLQAEGWSGEGILQFIADNSIAPDTEALTLKRIPVDLSVSDLDIQTKLIWDAVKACNSPPSLLTGHQGLVVVDRDMFGVARQRGADDVLLRNWLVTRIQFLHTIKGGFQVSTHPSETLLANLMVGAHPVPRLTRLTEVPVFTTDGRLVGKEGFDEASGVYYLPSPGLTNIGIPISPSADAVNDALGVFDDLVHDFPFVDDCDRAHALAFAVLPIVRSVVHGPTPLFRFEAPTPGTGKSMLMRMLADLTCAVAEMGQPIKEEMWATRITACLMKDPDALLIDNAEKIESADLKRLLTTDTWEDRILGVSRNFKAPVRAVFAVSLNNPLISRETMRRSLRVRLDAKLERPEQRTGWRHRSITEYARENRAEIVGALLTIAMFGLEHGGDGDNLPTLGSYESFSRRIGAILKVLNQPGFLGDREDESALSSVETSASAFVERWGNATIERAGAGFLVKELVHIAEETDGFALGRGDSDRAKQTFLGIWLSKRRGMVFGGWQIADPEKVTSGTIWHLKQL